MALVGIYPPSPHYKKHRRGCLSRARKRRRLRRFTLDGRPWLCYPPGRGGGYILQSRPLFHDWKRGGIRLNPYIKSGVLKTENTQNMRAGLLAFSLKKAACLNRFTRLDLERLVSFYGLPLFEL